MAKTIKNSKRRTTKTLTVKNIKEPEIVSAPTVNSDSDSNISIENIIYVRSLNDVALKFSHIEENHFNVFDITINSLTYQVMTVVADEQIDCQTPVYIIIDGKQIIIGIMKMFANSINFNANLKSCIIGYLAAVGKIIISD